MADDCDFDELDAPAIAHLLHHLHRIERQMTEINENQAHLDADVASLGQATASIETEISNLKQAVANGQPVDFTGLDAALGTLQGIAPSAPAPAPVVTPDPTPPADVPPADGSTPTA